MLVSKTPKYATSGTVFLTSLHERDIFTGLGIDDPFVLHPSLATVLLALVRKGYVLFSFFCLSGDKKSVTQLL